MSQAEILREARREFGWTQEAAAAKAGVSTRTWQSWEGEGDSAREAPAMLYRVLELYRRLQQAGVAVDWDQLAEDAARRSGGYLLRPQRAEYRTS